MGDSIVQDVTEECLVASCMMTSFVKAVLSVVNIARRGM